MDVCCGCNGVPNTDRPVLSFTPEYYAEKDVVVMVAVQDAG